MLSPIIKYRNRISSRILTKLVDFWLTQTPLINAKKTADRLWIDTCYLKYEWANPTRSFKDRQTEYLYSYFYTYWIKEYAHTSTGNSATSLVRGLVKYRKMYDPDFVLHLFISSYQILYHNFDLVEWLCIHILEDATVEDARKYQNKFIEARNIFTAPNELMIEANSIIYHEAIDQLIEIWQDVDGIVQTISKWYGILWAYYAIQKIKYSWNLATLPFLVVCQPALANPVVTCYRDNQILFSKRYKCNHTYDSVAHAIRRWDATEYYSKIYDALLHTKGYAFDASNQEILYAKKIVKNKEWLSICNTAAVSLASLKKYVHTIPDSHTLKLLITITGAPREPGWEVQQYYRIPKSKWQTFII